MIVNKKSNNEVILQLYQIFNLLANKYIILKIKKEKRAFDDWIEAELPQPSLIIEAYDGYFLGYAIRGKIKTKKQKKFYQDLSLRLKKTLMQKANISAEIKSIWYLQYALENAYIENNKKVYEMKDLAKACLSLNSKEEKTRKVTITTPEEAAVFAGTYEKSEDALFDFIRFKVYDFIRIKQQNNAEYTLEEVTDYAMIIADIACNVISCKKGISTAKCKAKNIAEWSYLYYRSGKKQRKTKNDKELTMIRSQNARKVAQIKEEKTRHKIKITLLKDKEKFLKKNGKLNVAKLAKYLDISRTTLYKHLQKEDIKQILQ